MHASDSNLHPAVAGLLRFFNHEHLADDLKPMAQTFANIAYYVAHETTGPETAASVRKLLEAKDCAVRATVAKRETGGD